MSLYSSGIQLLPRPDRSVLSIGSDVTRAILPDFDTVSELAIFTNRLFNWRIHGQLQQIYKQAIVGSTFIFFLIVLIFIIMVKKIVDGKFWLLRIIRRPSGNILVPNPMLAFLICAGLCCLIFTPFFLTAVGRYCNHQIDPPRNLFLWFSLPWLAFGHGLVWVVWGTYFATPGALLSRREESEISPINRFLRRADVITSLVIIIPLLMAVTLVVPAVIGSTQWQNALALEKQWQAQYSSMPNFTQDMVQQSQEIWFAALKATKIMAGVFILWTVYALLMGMTLFHVSSILIRAVRKDLARAKRQTRLEIEQGEKEEQATNARVSNVGGVDAWQANHLSGRENTVRVGKEEGIKFAENKAVSPAQKQEKGLEQALFQIYIQLLGIGPGALFLGIISLTFGLTVFSKLEQPSADGGTRLEHYIGGIWLALMYVICVAGALLYLPVIYKSAEDRFQRQAAGQIHFEDITKGSAHIRSTFCEATEETIAMSPTFPDALAQQHLDESIEEPKQGRGFSIMMAPKDYNSGSWDVEAEAVTNSAETLSPPLTSGVCP